MKPGMKMLMLTNARKGDSERTDRRMDYAEDNYPRSGWEAREWPESRFRDRRGREHYDNGRYAPMRGDTNIEIEGRFRDDRGRERYDDGRFAPMRNDYDGMEDRMDGPESRRRRDSRGRFRSDGYPRMGDDWMEDNYRRGGSREGRTESGWYPNRPFPVYQEGGNERMNQIGFVAGGEEFPHRYRTEATHHTGNELEYRTSPRMGGHGFGGAVFTKEMAEEWMRGMHNEDGTKGPHWTMEQAKQVMAQKGIQTDPVKFWVALNAIYSDLVAVAKKHNINTMDFYVDAATAFWLRDQDAVEDKLGAYYEYVVKH